MWVTGVQTCALPILSLRLGRMIHVTSRGTEQPYDIGCGFHAGWWVPPPRTRRDETVHGPVDVPPWASNRRSSEGTGRPCVQVREETIFDGYRRSRPAGHTNLGSVRISVGVGTRRAPHVRDHTAKRKATHLKRVRPTVYRRMVRWYPYHSKKYTRS